MGRDACRPDASSLMLRPVCTEPVVWSIERRVRVTLAVAGEDRVRDERALLEFAEIVHGYRPQAYTERHWDLVIG